MRSINDFIRDKAGFAIAGMAMVCLIMFFAGLIIIGIVLIWLFAFGGLQTIGNMCLLFTVPLLLVVITAILAKKYLFKKGGN